LKTRKFDDDLCFITIENIIGYAQMSVDCLRTSKLVTLGHLLVLHSKPCICDNF